MSCLSLQVILFEKLLHIGSLGLLPRHLFLALQGLPFQALSGVHFASRRRSNGFYLCCAICFRLFFGRKEAGQRVLFRSTLQYLYRYSNLSLSLVLYICPSLSESLCLSLNIYLCLLSLYISLNVFISLPQVSMHQPPSFLYLPFSFLHRSLCLRVVTVASY